MNIHKKELLIYRNVYQLKNKLYIVMLTDFCSNLKTESIQRARLILTVADKSKPTGTFSGTTLRNRGYRFICRLFQRLENIQGGNSTSEKRWKVSFSVLTVMQVKKESSQRIKQ